jgi:hypothetical protein
MMKFRYKEKDYIVEEPTVEMWSKLTMLQDWTDEREFAVEILSFMTGLSIEEIENSDFEEVLRVSQEISKFLIDESEKFYNEFEFNNKRYKFLDLPNLTFGEFIDIDTYLSKEPYEKKKELPLLMAMLYREIDEDGNYKPYNSKQLQTKAEEFKKLPVKYVKGASSFFFRLDKTSLGNLRGSLFIKLKLMVKMTWMFVKVLVLISFGAGLALLSRWQTKILQKLKKLLNIH